MRPSLRPIDGHRPGSRDRALCASSCTAAGATSFAMFLGTLGPVRPCVGKQEISCARSTLEARAFMRLRRASHFSLLGQRKVTQREATPLGAFRASCPESACGMAWLFDGTSMCRRKGIGIVPIPLRAGRPCLTATQGPRVEQRASCAHSSKSHIRSAPLSFALPLQPLRGCAPSASRDGSRLCRVPCAAVRRGRQAAKRASTGSRCLFAGTWRYRRKARPRLTDFSPMDGRKAPSGVPLSWVTFSRASERK